MGDVNPSVSTDGRSFTIALRLARFRLPSDRIAWLTVGNASGMAAMASETALMNNTSQAGPRLRPNANITTMVTPAAAAIHKVSVLSSLVSGDSSLAGADNIPEILPSSAPGALPVRLP